MSTKEHNSIVEDHDKANGALSPRDPLQPEHSANESPVSDGISDLEPHVRIIRAARPALTYERAE